MDELQVLDMEYEVEWGPTTQDEVEGVREVLARGQIGRKRSPLTRPLLRSWLQEAAACEPLEVQSLCVPFLSTDKLNEELICVAKAFPVGAGFLPITWVQDVTSSHAIEGFG